MSYDAAKALMLNGPSRPTLYSVSLGKGANFFTNQYLRFFCQTTAIPGVRTNTSIAAGQEYMGITREMPTAVIYSKPLTMTIIENANFSIYKDLRSWFDKICQNSNQERGQRSQRMNYYKDYVCDITITKLEQSTVRGSLGGIGAGLTDLSYKPVLTVTFLNAYPTDVGAINLASDATDQATTFDMSFTYESYNIAKNPLSLV